MKNLPRALSALGLGIFFLAGCAAMPQRRAIRETPGPNPMTGSEWAAVTGIYTGPVRSVNRRFASEGLSVADARLELSGSAEQPRVFLKTQTGYAGAWSAYVERNESLTNIPERRYGTQGFIAAATHSPDGLTLQFRPGPFSTNSRAFWIVTFRGRDCAEVTAVARAGWHGEGTLHRVPVLPGACP